MSTSATVLVTGAGGFVGQPLCQNLKVAGYAVKGTVRYIDGNVNAENTRGLIATGPLQHYAGWGSILKGVTAVIHLAALVHVMDKHARQDLATYQAVNVTVTKNLLGAAAQAGVKRFIFVSSVKAVGEGGDRPYSETSAAEPADAYAISKLEAERVVAEVGRETGIETVIVRLPLVYGPGVQANFLRLMRLVDKGLPLPLASVTNRRSMLYMGNLIDALKNCIEHSNAAGETFMVSDGDDFSTPGLIREIARAMGRKSHLLPFPPTLLRAVGTLFGKGQEVDRLLGSLSVDTCKIRSSLDWAPPYTVEQGIAKTVAWYLASIPKPQAH